MKMLEATFFCRILCEQCHAGVSAWLRKTLVALSPAHMPVRVRCKTGTTSARIVFSRCQEFVATHRDDGLFVQLTVPFLHECQSESPEDREIGRRFALLWKVLAPKFQAIFFVCDDKGNLVVPAFDVRAQVFSMHDRRNGVGQPIL